MYGLEELRSGEYFDTFRSIFFLRDVVKADTLSCNIDYVSRLGRSNESPVDIGYSWIGLYIKRLPSYEIALDIDRSLVKASYLASIELVLQLLQEG
jgi:hypothetical protein